MQLQGRQKVMEVKLQNGAKVKDASFSRQKIHLNSFFLSSNMLDFELWNLKKARGPSSSGKNGIKCKHFVCLRTVKDV